MSNYNGFKLDTPPPYTDPNTQWDEYRFAHAIAPFLDEYDYPRHAVIDQGRSGNQPGIRSEWGHWCNVREAGFGMRPTTDVADDVIDAVVWVKPGGESDGTSDESAARFDEMCVGPSAFIPSPEAGDWHQAYFEMLIENANPSLL